MENGKQLHPTYKPWVGNRSTLFAPQLHQKLTLKYLPIQLVWRLDKKPQTAFSDWDLFDFYLVFFTIESHLRKFPLHLAVESHWPLCPDFDVTDEVIYLII